MVVDTMHLMQRKFIVCILLQMMQAALYVSTYDVSYEYDDDISQVNHINPDPELRTIEHMMMREMADDDPVVLSDDEIRVRAALAHSMQDTRSRRTISEILPVLQSLSDKQRHTLATLIATQTGGKSDRSMYLAQVSEDYPQSPNVWKILAFMVFSN